MLSSISARRSRISSMSGSGPTSGWYSARGAKSRWAPSRAPASSTWLISRSSSEMARPTSPSRAMAWRAIRKLSTWSAICWANSLVSPSIFCGSFMCRSPPCERAPQGDLVGVLEITAYRQSTRQPRHAQLHWLQQPGEIGRRGLTLEVRIRGEDDLGDRAVGQSGHQLAHPQLVRTDAVDRRDRPTQDVVAAPELTGPFDR